MILDEFRHYGDEVYHCDRCHRLVRTYDSDDFGDQLAMLAAHLDFNCAENPIFRFAARVAS